MSFRDERRSVAAASFGSDDIRIVHCANAHREYGREASSFGSVTLGDGGLEVGSQGGCPAFGSGPRTAARNVAIRGIHSARWPKMPRFVRLFAIGNWFESRLRWPQPCAFGELAEIGVESWANLGRPMAFPRSRSFAKASARFAGRANGEALPRERTAPPTANIGTATAACIT